MNWKEVSILLVIALAITFWMFWWEVGKVQVLQEQLEEQLIKEVAYKTEIAVYTEVIMELTYCD